MYIIIKRFLQLGSGIHPSPKEILICMDVFTSGPYNINKINVNHVVSFLILVIVFLS